MSSSYIQCIVLIKTTIWETLTLLPQFIIMGVRLFTFLADCRFPIGINREDYATISAFCVLLLLLLHHYLHKNKCCKAEGYNLTDSKTLLHRIWSLLHNDRGWLFCMLPRAMCRNILCLECCAPNFSCLLYVFIRCVFCCKMYRKKH